MTKAETPVPVKRGRGRPRKIPLPAPTPEEVEPVKRGRGRPRKIPVPVEVTAVIEIEPVKRGRGRPKKQAPAAPPNVPPVVPVTEPVNVIEKEHLEYKVMSPDDLLFWAEHAANLMFSKAWDRYKALTKKGPAVEIRWYLRHIDIVYL